MEVLVIYPICWRTVYGSLPYEGIIKGDRYDNRFITPGMICVIEDNIRFCYREFNVQDYTPIKWIEGVSRIPDIPYV